MSCKIIFIIVLYTYNMHNNQMKKKKTVVGERALQAHNSSPALIAFLQLSYYIFVPQCTLSCVLEMATEELMQRLCTTTWVCVWRQHWCRGLWGWQTSSCSPCICAVLLREAAQRSSLVALADFNPQARVWHRRSQMGAHVKCAMEIPQVPTRM